MDIHGKPVGIEEANSESARVTENGSKNSSMRLEIN